MRPFLTRSTLSVPSRTHAIRAPPPSRRVRVTGPVHRHHHHSPNRSVTRVRRPRPPPPPPRPPRPCTTNRRRRVPHRSPSRRPRSRRRPVGPRALSALRHRCRRRPVASSTARKCTRNPSLRVLPAANTTATASRRQAATTASIIRTRTAHRPQRITIIIAAAAVANRAIVRAIICPTMTDRR